MKGFDDFDLSAGDVLRGERATHGLELIDVATKMKLPISMLLEIEGGYYNSNRPIHLTNNIIRDYANFLELDPSYVKKLYWDDVDRNTSVEDIKPLTRHASTETAPLNLLTILKRYFRK